jgi:hypothetical protein
LPHCAGFKLGSSIAAAGDVLALGFGGNAIASADAKMGGYFYARMNGMTDLSVSAQEQPRGFASEDMACFALSAGVDCFVLNADANARNEESSAIWKQVKPRLEGPSCSGEMCALPVSCSAWGRVLAIVGRASSGKRYVAAYSVAENGEDYAWNCEHGCSSSAIESVDDATFAESVSLNDKLLAVGSSGGNIGSMYPSDGTVRLYQATGSVSRYSEWREDVVLRGPAGFGKTVSLGPHFLLVQAPGNSTVAPAVHIYRVGVDGGSVTAEEFCMIRYPGQGLSSLLGESIAQSTDGINTLAIIGAPGANRAFAIFLKAGLAPSCSFGDTFSPPEDDDTTADRFGSAVAITRQFVFIGSPQYERWYKLNTSGLIYSYAYCHRGSRPIGDSVQVQDEDGQVIFERYLPVCKLCPEDSTSEGGIASSCTQCEVGFPENSELTFGCNFICQKGYFGPDCKVCSVAMSGAYLPANAKWVDGATECSWTCDRGHEIGNSSYCQPCSELDTAATIEFRAKRNVQWKLGTCDEYECLDGFHVSKLDRRCKLCSEAMLDSSVQPPLNSRWIDGSATCDWRPLLGFTCASDADFWTCSGCAEPPANAHFIDTAELFPRSLCEFACDEHLGYYGHPRFPGVCTSCPDLMVNYSHATPPKNAVWKNESNITCDYDAFACNSGYVASSTDRFCCPETITNSVSDPTYRPCGRRCQAGFRWDNESASCLQCLANPPNVQRLFWGTDCNFTCKNSAEEGRFFGGPEEGDCFTCAEYHELKGVVLPARSVSNPVSSTCMVDDWICSDPTTTRSISAVPPGCCPNELPDETAEVAPAGTLRGTCGFRCKEGYTWDSWNKTCSACTGFSAALQPNNSAWNYTGCSWECKAGFRAVFDEAGSLRDCLECTAFAASQEWSLPENGVWRLSEDHVAGVQCTADSWDCAIGYHVNRAAKLCCKVSDHPYPLPANGYWDSASCTYRCNAHYFPEVPTANSEQEVFSRCSSCEILLSELGVVRWEFSQDGRCEGGRCEAIRSKALPDSCMVSLLGSLTVSDVTAKTMRGYSASWAFRNAVASATGQASSVLSGDGVTITKIVQTSVAARRWVHEHAERDSIGAAVMRSEAALLEQSGVDAVSEPLEALDIWSDEEYEEFMSDPERARRAGIDSVAVSFVIKTLSPILLANVLAALRGSAASTVTDALRALGIQGTASIEPSEIISAPSSNTWECGAGAASNRYSLNEHTQRCCPNDFFSAPLAEDSGRYTWEENGCRWNCLPSFKGSSCLTCTEYREGSYKPAYSEWDDSSPDCTWKCISGYVSVGGVNCVSITQLAGTCSAHDRCASCLQEEHCVFCNGKCVPGQKTIGVQEGCPFVNDVVSPTCDCEGRKCLKECKFKTCDECIKVLPLKPA